ncbi:MAG: MMPL family transporter, partial [Candidatus Adiutrix sp.]|nr:MMPL family transporter [Candidatus Adiutrix sp.]
MSRLVVRLYVFFARRRLFLALLTLAFLAASLGLALDMKPDKSLTALIPDSSAHLRESAALLDMAPFARVMLVQLTAERPAAEPWLAEAADRLADGLEPGLLTPVGRGRGWPELPDLMAIIPALCDRACLSRLTEAAKPERLEAALAGLKNDLAGLGGLTSLFWRVDPLGLRGEIFSRLPQSQGFPAPDPAIGYPLTPDGRRLLLILKPRVSMNDAEGAKKIMAELERLTAELPAGISAQVAGAHRHTAANALAIERDLTLTMTLAMVLILAIYLFLVRSPGALWLFLTPAAAVLAAAAGLRLIFPAASGLALGFGAAVLGIAEDYAVHVHFALRRAPDKSAALALTARPLMMSVVLCAAGFGVLMFSSIPAIRQLALFSALALAAGYVWAMLVLPHCPGMDRPRESGAPPKTGRAAAEKSRFGPRLVLPLSLFLAAAAGLMAANLPGGLSVRDLGLSDAALLADQRSIEAVWRMDGGRRVFLAGGATEEEALALAAETEAALNLGGEARSAVSLAALLPPLDEQRRNIAAWNAFLAERGPLVRESLAEAARRAGFAEGAFEPFGRWFFAPPPYLSSAGLKKAGLDFLTD